MKTFTLTIRPLREAWTDTGQDVQGKLVAMRRQSEKSLRRLRREYPMLEWVEDYYRGLNDCPLAVCVTVKRGDPDMLYQQPDDLDGDRSSLLDARRPNLKASREECVITSPDKSVVGARYYWGVGWAPSMAKFVKEVFDPSHRRWAHAGSAMQVDRTVGLLAYVSYVEWFPRSMTIDEKYMLPSCDPVEAELCITLYRPPAEGWDGLLARADVLQNVHLHSWKLLGTWALNTPEFQRANDAVSGLVKSFERQVWLEGLAVIVDASTIRGMSGMFGDVKVLTYVIAGRTSVQLERGGVSLTIAATDDPRDPRMGIQSVDGTFPELKRLVDDAIRFWSAADADTRSVVHQDNPKVGLGI